MEDKVYPLMFHHELAGEKLLGSCFGYLNNRTFVTAGHCFDGIEQYPKIHVGIPTEVERNPPLPDKRTVRKALQIARNSQFDIAVVRVQDEWCDGPLSKPYFHNIFGIDDCTGQTVIFRGYTDDRLGDNSQIIARSKSGTITLDYRQARNNSHHIELAAHIEHKNSGGPVLNDQMNTGTPIAMIVTLKGGSHSNREDNHGEALLLHPFKADLQLAADGRFSSLNNEWEVLL